MINIAILFSYNIPIPNYFEILSKEYQRHLDNFPTFLTLLLQHLCDSPFGLFAMLDSVYNHEILEYVQQPKFQR